MKKISLALVLGSILFQFKAHGSSDCTMYYAGINPLNSQEPLFESLKNDLNTENELSEKQFLIERINTTGIDDYIKNASEGLVSSSLSIGGRKYNLLDLALLKKANTETINTLFNRGVYLSTHAIPLILKTYQTTIAIDKIYNFSESSLEDILISNGSYEYSIVNFLLLNKEFDTVDYLVEKYYLDVTENIKQGSLININNFSIQERLDISKQINVKEYISSYNYQEKERKTELIKKEIFNSEYKIYKLKHNCIDFRNSDNFIVKYAVKLSKILKLIDEKNFDLKKANLKDVVNSFQNPIIQEYLSKVIRKKNNSRSAKTLNDFEKKSWEDLYALNRDSKYFYISDNGLTLKEYLFLAGKWSWETDSIEMSMDRLAYYLMNMDFFPSEDILKELMKINDFTENGKNLSYFLLKYAPTNSSILAINNSMPSPYSEYGINPLEMIFIKAELSPDLLSSIKFISKTLSKNYVNRLQK